MSSIRTALFGCLLFFSITATAQTGFPKNWEGIWKGELQWYKTGTAEPQKVNMELHILPGDSARTWQWQMIYGSVTADNRPYKLVAKDSTGIHWVVDEGNGIVLDQYWVGNRLTGAFTVMNSTILNSYYLEGDNLVVEFYSISAKPVNTSGQGTEESPKVDSYRSTGYQKAILRRYN